MNSLRSLIFVPLLVSVGVSGCGPSKDTGTPTAPGAAPTTTASGSAPAAGRPDKPDFSLTAEDISKEVFADEKAAAARYKGKWVELTGSEEWASKYGHASGFNMTGGKKKPGDLTGYIIRIGVPPADVEKAWMMSKGQKVKAFGRVQDVSGLMLNVDQAAVTELEPSKLLTVKAEDLAADYAKDGDAAEKKYRGEAFSREIAVTGTVAELTQEKDFQYVVLAGSGSTVVKCTFDKDDWKALKKGDKVTVKGDLSSFDPQQANSPTVNSGFLVKKG